MSVQSHQQEAALPWGTAERDEQAFRKDLASQMGCQLGQRVEVKWRLEGDGTAFTQWWGAVLDHRPDGETDGEGRQVYVLRYDPNPELGYEEQECCRVTFLDQHVLYDLGEDEELAWRLAGDSWEEPAGSESDEEAENSQVYTLNQIAAAIEASERRRGRTVDEDAAEALKAFPQDQQRIIADGFRAFTDHIAAGMAKLKEQHGDNYVVTAADVTALTAAARRQ
ncbi:hypothetical protein D9Q98_001412 [Chlorella vulgaris]|uniref:Uncharacterized protein n=1 Tax=Chlorella vulgaris TaxID=3077 RepID=A0A9D4Z2M9_CHLVU|nr:hypothetical protein D9Q98_001412 [Chlorella vulgaris]